MLSNIIFNSIEFTDKRDIKIVLIKYCVKGKNIILSVVDTVSRI